MHEWKMPSRSVLFKIPQQDLSSYNSGDAHFNLMK